MQTRNAAHTGAFLVGRQNLVLLCLTPLMLRIHDARLAASLAQELLATGAIFAILDDLRAVAFWTVKNDRLAYHVSFIASFRKTHYQAVMLVVVRTSRTRRR